MSHEAMLETIKTELDDADAATPQSVWETLRQAKQSSTEFPVAIGGQISRRSSTAIASENWIKWFAILGMPLQHHKKSNYSAIAPIVEVGVSSNIINVIVERSFL